MVLAFPGLVRGGDPEDKAADAGGDTQNKSFQEMASDLIAMASNLEPMASNKNAEKSMKHALLMPEIIEPSLSVLGST